MKLSIVSYLDPDSTKYVRDLQQGLSKVSGSNASLNSWEPHITVGDGIEINDSELEQVKAGLVNLAHGIKPFSINLQGVGSRDDRIGGKDEVTTPYVVYLNAIVNDELQTLVDQVKKRTGAFSKWYVMPRPYLAHVTLAFRDLTKDGFDSGLRSLSGKRPSTMSKVGHLSLVEKLPDVDRELLRFDLG